MLLSAVSVLVVAQSISEIPEWLMNNPVYAISDIMQVCIIVIRDVAVQRKQWEHTFTVRR